MKKKHLIVFDIDDTLTKSGDQHHIAYVKTMQQFGITNINQGWKNYMHHTDSFILKENYEANIDKQFDFSFIFDFEKEMTNTFLTLLKTSEISGAKKVVDFFMRKTNYAICFATGSLLQPALVKLDQAGINFVPELVVASNTIFDRETIVKKAIESAENYFQVDNFETIISVGDGIWDLRTAKNIGVHFLGIGEKNYVDFKNENIKSHINDWAKFDFKKIQQELEII
jgi:phosphoglycolate phosphatase-like HAD superfamily hydrolase